MIDRYIDIVIYLYVHIYRYIWSKMIVLFMFAYVLTVIAIGITWYPCFVRGVLGVASLWKKNPAYCSVLTFGI